MNTRPLALIGFPCSGKTTVGQLLAQHLGRPWLDSDTEIEASTGHPPAYWLQTQGEPAFREIERGWLKTWNPLTPCVLSTGGGLPCYQNNLDLLKGKALTVYLDTPFDQLEQRLNAPPGHALTRIYDAAGLQALYQRRGAIYRHADLKIKADQSPQAVLVELTERLAHLN